MSALSGLGAKGEKSKGKFTSININNIYRGTSQAPQKATGRTIVLLVELFLKIGQLLSTGIDLICCVLIVCQPVRLCLPDKTLGY